MANDYYSKYADTFDRLQPLKIEMYRFYHELALDFLPFKVHQGFRMLDLGSGTGTFLGSVLERYPNAECVAVEYSSEMLEFVKTKTHRSADRVELYQRDLNEGLPADIGTFDIVSSFSTVHHLTDQNKLSLLRQVKDVLKPGGWFFLIDAMMQRFDDEVFRTGRERERRQAEARFAEAGMDIRESDDLKALREGGDGVASHVDRITSLSNHLKWLDQAGFRTVDHVWHFWMEHFIIARR
jgi:SAM-dependent methyltransferase